MPPPSPYLHWRGAARKLLEPLAALMQSGRAALPMAGNPSDHDAQADRLESFARPLTLAAFWLQSASDRSAVLQPASVGGALAAPRCATSAQPTFDDAAFRARIASWFREALVLGTDADSPEYWGPDASYHQHHVEMGLIAIALQIAPRDLWEPLAGDDRAQVARWFATCRGSGIVNNNHLFMSVHILEFLGKHGFGHRTDRAVITAHLDQLETMHRGGGWFEDGINQAYDHYNAYAFHFYGLMWAHFHGRADAVHGEPSRTARATRWREWARLFVGDYQHFFAASGEHPAFGRSITYRFNCLNVFGLALVEGCTDIAPGVLRRLCTRNLDFFLSRPIYQEQGCLAPGFTDRFDRIVEGYSCAASPYWAAKGFTPLLLPPEHAFWKDPEEPLPAERGFVRVMKAPGLVTRSVPGGDVEILNAGSMVGNTQLRYGAWKWGKLSYRTGVHFTFAFPEISNVSFDSALTQQLNDGRIFGRHSTVAVELAEDHLGYTYNLGAKTGQVNTSVETFVFWRDGWLLHVHHCEARQPVVLRLGGFALPVAREQVAAVVLDAPADIIPVQGRLGLTAPTLAAFADSRGTVLQLLHGTATPTWDNRLDEGTERRHVAAPYHVTPLFETPRHSGRNTLAALSWAGARREEAVPWRVVSGKAGEWRLSHPTLGEWRIAHWSCPALEPRT